MQTRWPFILIVLTYLLSGYRYATLTPAWQNPDEPAHYNYIRYLATYAHFPELVPECYNQAYLNELTSRRFPPDLTINTVCYEYHQPPLYYLLLTPVFHLTHGSLFALRFVSVLLGLGTVVLAYALSRTLYPDHPLLAYSTMAFTAFVPMHAAMLASVNNDSLAGCLLAALLLLLTKHRPTSPPKYLILIGILLGSILLTKLTIYLALALVAVWLTRQPHWPRQAAGIYGLALLIAAPWYGRNLWLYGAFDLVGLQRHDEVVLGQLRTLDYIATVGGLTYGLQLSQTTFHSFWGQFGWMAVPMDGRVYTVLVLWSMIALSGWLPPLRSTLKPTHQAAMPLLGVTLLLTFAAFAWYNSQFVQFQGRYLFPAIIPLGLLFNQGLYQAFNPTQRGQLLAVITFTALGLFVMSPDKWTLFLTSLPLGLALFHTRYPVPAPYVIIASYLSLAGLNLIAPNWFIVPYLAP